MQQLRGHLGSRESCLRLMEGQLQFVYVAERRTSSTLTECRIHRVSKMLALCPRPVALSQQAANYGGLTRPGSITNESCADTHLSRKVKEDVVVDGMLRLADLPWTPQLRFVCYT